MEAKELREQLKGTDEKYYEVTAVSYTHLRGGVPQRGTDQYPGHHRYVCNHKFRCVKHRGRGGTKNGIKCTD